MEQQKPSCSARGARAIFGTDPINLKTKVRIPFILQPADFILTILYDQVDLPELI